MDAATQKCPGCGDIGCNDPQCLLTVGWTPDVHKPMMRLPSGVGAGANSDRYGGIYDPEKKTLTFKILVLRRGWRPTEKTITIKKG